MKKLSFVMIATLLGSTVMAQSLDDVKKAVLLGQGKIAREAVDKYLAVEKNAKKPDGWYYKGYAYALVAKDSALSLADAFNLRKESFAALKKYLEMDPKAGLTKNDSNIIFLDNYGGWAQDLGIREYNQKNYQGAFDNFKAALEIHDYAVAQKLEFSNGYKFTVLDSQITLYAAIAANLAKQPDVAAEYYKKLVDAQVKEEGYIDAYQYLTQYYKDKKDKANFSSIIEKGKQYFPKNNEYWTAMEIEEATEGVEKPALFDSYDALLVKYPTNYVIAYNHAVELYRYIYSDELKDKNTDVYKAKLQEVLKKAIAINSSSEANFLMANFLYNNSIDISDAARKIRGPKPEDLKKRKAMEAEAVKVMEAAIPYAEKVIELFPNIAKPKSGEKLNNRQAITILKNIYENKKDAAKTAVYEKKLKELE